MVSEGTSRNRYCGFVAWVLVRSRVSRGERLRPGPRIVRSYLLGWDRGGEDGRYANEQETCQEAVIVFGRYL